MSNRRRLRITAKTSGKMQRVQTPAGQRTAALGQARRVGRLLGEEGVKQWLEKGEQDD